MSREPLTSMHFFTTVKLKVGHAHVLFPGREVTRTNTRYVSACIFSQRAVIALPEPKPIQQPSLKT